ncbi:glycoprotein-N-acetylgalactosamine 3-beta-galactosyltransferase 1-like [Paramacrobiotus metropolitanus]|uniref:glycoprotein-N-acetylgalactosamine 3-beta-galactosyltransferase 1-like n=1 Tax=Paramacrobiotus metropolitanus TaxID=2943436 RepID=UPI0024463A89|nr:glycoprotein-N-acetylgalactosamine 3-beta-galactosyltransferase 1-like [Paramacrobiotus metropolitanus]
MTLTIGERSPRVQIIKKNFRNNSLLNLFVDGGYMSGGAGYVLSREAVRRLIERGLNKQRCRNDSGGDEDLEMGRCLERVNVKPKNSRDEHDRGRFFPFNITYHMSPGHMSRTTDWYPQHTHNNDGDLLNCCSDTAIAFHYVKPIEMYQFEFLLYGLRMHVNRFSNVMQI